MRGLEQLDPDLVRKTKGISGALGGKFGSRGIGGKIAAGGTGEAKLSMINAPPPRTVRDSHNELSPPSMVAIEGRAFCSLYGHDMEVGLCTHNPTTSEDNRSHHSRRETGGRCLRRRLKEPALPALNLGFLASRAVSNELLVWPPCSCALVGNPPKLAAYCYPLR